MRFIAGTLLAALVASSAIAQPPAAPPVAAPDPSTVLATDPLNTAATFAYIMDGDSGIPLYSKRGDEPMMRSSVSGRVARLFSIKRPR